MKKYVDENGHILFLSPSVGVDISDSEAKEIMELINNRPVAAGTGVIYRILDATKTWEPVPPFVSCIDPKPNATAEERIAALEEQLAAAKILLGLEE